MNYHAIYHRPKQNYAYAYDKKTIHLRIRTAKDEVERAEVIFGDPYHWVAGGGGGNLNAEGASGWMSKTVEMKKEASTDYLIIGLRLSAQSLDVCVMLSF